MSPTTAPVVVFEQQESDVRSARAEKLSWAARDATRAVDEALFKAGLKSSITSIHAKAPSGLRFDGLRHAEWAANFRLTLYLERQVEKYRKLLRRVLASDGVTETDRTAVLQGLYGTRGRAIDARVFSESERKLIDDYRKLGDADRQMLRRLFDRLVTTAPSGTDE